MVELTLPISAYVTLDFKKIRNDRPIIVK